MEYFNVPILDLFVFVLGKLLLSVSRDKTLYTWNLVKGRPAFITNIKVSLNYSVNPFLFEKVLMKMLFCIAINNKSLSI